MHQMHKIHDCFANQTEISIEQRAVLVETQLAMGIAYTLNLPSAPVESLRMYWAGQIQAQVGHLVSQFNENFPVNVASTMNLVFEFYKIRYYLVHCPAMLCAQPENVLTLSKVFDIDSKLEPRYQTINQIPAVEVRTSLGGLIKYFLDTVNQK